MPNLRDSIITLLEDMVEHLDTDIDPNPELIKRANAALEILEDQRDGYGSHSWDEEA